MNEAREAGDSSSVNDLLPTTKQLSAVSRARKLVFLTWGWRPRLSAVTLFAGSIFKIRDDLGCRPRLYASARFPGYSHYDLSAGGISNCCPT